MKRKRSVFLFTMFILIILASILILHNLAPTGEGYFELLEVKKEQDWVQSHIFYVKWHGRTTNLTFTLYKRTRVAGYPVPGGVGAKWIQSGFFGKNVTIKDGDVCKVKNGDKFKLSLSIFATYIKVSYDNKTVWFHGETGEMEESS